MLSIRSKPKNTDNEIIFCIFRKNKNPFRGGCFLLVRGAGGTKVELFWTGFIESDKFEIDPFFKNHSLRVGGDYLNQIG